MFEGILVSYRYAVIFDSAKLPIDLRKKYTLGGVRPATEAEIKLFSEKGGREAKCKDLGIQVRHSNFRDVQFSTINIESQGLYLRLMKLKEQLKCTTIENVISELVSYYESEKDNSFVKSTYIDKIISYIVKNKLFFEQQIDNQLELLNEIQKILKK